MKKQQYYLMNADVPRDQIQARDCARGTIIVLKKSVENCPFGRTLGEPTMIPAGRYQVVNRKNFRGGYQTVEVVS